MWLGTSAEGQLTQWVVTVPFFFLLHIFKKQKQHVFVIFQCILNEGDNNLPFFIWGIYVNLHETKTSKNYFNKERIF